MSEFTQQELNAFIVAAKSASYVGRGAHVASCRPGSQDIVFRDGGFSYLDSYFGGADFIGQEVVWFEDRPVWAMNYYGRILQPDLIQPAEAGQILQASLSAMYVSGRFLGGWEYVAGESTYEDASEGSVSAFSGHESITRHGVKVYELVYHGGLIR